jgi:hypothetical protein
MAVDEVRKKKTRMLTVCKALLSNRFPEPFEQFGAIPGSQ